METSITKLIFKKRDKVNPADYRGISLLNAISKLLTGLIAEELRKLIPISEEQQGFPKNRPTVDTIYVVGARNSPPHKKNKLGRI